MIEDEIRQSFHRHEHLVPDPAGVSQAVAATVRRRRTRRRTLAAGGVAMLVFAALAVPMGFRAWLTDTASTPLLPGGTNAPTALAGRPLNFLIAGLDDGQFHMGLDRSDAIIVAHVPADRRHIYLITIPRDLEVKDKTNKPMKINSAYALGGFAELSRVVSELTGLTFDGAATVGLSGMSALTDAIGGVDFCVKEAAISFHTGHRFDPGCYHFTGAQARDYLRQRMNFPGAPTEPPAYRYGAILRDEHQVAYLGAVIEKLASDSALSDPSKLTALIGLAGTGLHLDTRGLSPLDVATELRPAGRDVVGIAMPVTDVAHRENTGALNTTAETARLFAAVRADDLDRWAAAHHLVPAKSASPTPGASRSS